MNARAIEERFIAAVVKDDTGERLNESRKLPPDAFSDARCKRAWQALTKAASYETGALHPDVCSFFAHETLGTDYLSDQTEVYVSWLRRLGLPGVDVWRSALPTAGKDKIRARMASKLFNVATPPPEPAPRFLIDDKPICTPGNLTNLIAQAKAGKTAVIAAMIAAAICAEYQDDTRDTLGLTATAPGTKRLLHFDTEQSPFDHDQLVRRSLRRAGVDTPPEWLVSYALAGFSAEELRTALRLALNDAKAAGGVFAVIVDGTADMVNDVNDPAECNAFVAELHALAIEHACPIVNVVHENPGQDGGKMRGHLGSQLERKAESNIRLRKNDGVTVLFSEKMRRAPILEKDGPRFHWSDDAGMHVSCEGIGASREEAKRAELREVAEEVIGSGRLRYSEVVNGIVSARGGSVKTAERRFGEMKRAGVIVRDSFQFWTLPENAAKAA